jgi:hypothetical protein
MKQFLVCLVAAYALSAADTRTFKGTVTDGECPRADHSRMQMGSNDAECARACVDAHGAAFVLYDGKETFTLKGAGLEKFAAQKVRIVGTFDAKSRTIQVESITPSK